MVLDECIGFYWFAHVLIIDEGYMGTHSGKSLKNQVDPTWSVKRGSSIRLKSLHPFSISF